MKSSGFLLTTKPDDGADAVRRWLEITPAIVSVDPAGHVRQACHPAITIWRQEGKAQPECLPVYDTGYVSVQGVIRSADGSEYYIDERASLEDHFTYDQQQRAWLLDKALAAGDIIEETIVAEWMASYNKPFFSCSLTLDRQGRPGTAYERRYRSINSQTCPYDPNTSLSGWQESPTPISASARYRFVTERHSTDGGTTWTTWSPPVVDGYLAADGTSISIKGRAVAVIEGNMSVNSLQPDMMQQEGIISASTVVAERDVVLYNGSQQSDLAFYDSQKGWFVDDHDDAAPGDSYLSVDGDLWVRNSGAGKRWINSGNIQGPAGEDATVYRLEAAPTVVNFRSNAVGEFSGKKNVTCIVRRTRGSVTDVISGTSAYTYDGMTLRYRMTGPQTVSVWLAGNSVEVNYTSPLSGGVTGIEFALFKAGSTTTTVDRVYVPIVLDGRRGATGADGKAFYPMGAYDTSEAYVRDDDGMKIPMVFFDDGDWNATTQTRGSYYYLAAPTNADGSTHYAPAAEDADGRTYPYKKGVWARADHFGVVISQGIFALYAKLGKGVFCGDYFYSMNGTIGGVPYNDGAPYTSGGVTRPAYAWFKGDPEQQSGVFFTPAWWVDLHTGKMSAAGGKMVINADGSGKLAGGNICWDKNGSASFRGDVHATSGSFEGEVRSRLAYSPVKVITGQHSINLEEEPYSFYYIAIADGSTVPIIIPSAADYMGLEISFFQPPTNTRLSLGGKAVLSVADGSNFDYDVGEISMFGKSNFEYASLQPSSAATIAVPVGHVFTLKSDGERWIVISRVVARAGAHCISKTAYDYSGRCYMSATDMRSRNIFQYLVKTGTTLTLPSENDVADAFDWPAGALPADFVYRFTIVVNRASQATLTVNGLTDNNGNSASLAMAKGDVAEILCSQFNGFHYQLLSRSS